jgi:hypothetical protein
MHRTAEEIEQPAVRRVGGQVKGLQLVNECTSTYLQAQTGKLNSYGCDRRPTLAGAAAAALAAAAVAVAVAAASLLTCTCRPQVVFTCLRR